MSRTYRRKNSHDKYDYVDAWYHGLETKQNLGIDSYAETYLQRFNFDIKNHNNYYHSDRYKPYSSKKLKFAKKECNRLSRIQNKKNLVALKKMNDFEDFSNDNENIYKRNKIHVAWVY